VLDLNQSNIKHSNPNFSEKLFILQWELTSQTNMVESTTQTVFINSCISRSKASTISWRRIIGNLVHEKFTQFILNFGYRTFLWWVGGGGRRRRRRRRRRSCGWCWWHGSGTRHNFCFKPHVRKNLTNTFLYCRIKVAVTWLD